MTEATVARGTTVRDRIRTAAEAGDWRLALRLAAPIAHDLGEHGPAIRRAHEAHWHPDFARQLGRDLDEVTAAGIDALRIAVGIAKPDDLSGMAWWNSLTEPARAFWLRRAGSAVPADAWAAYKREARS